MGTEAISVRRGRPDKREAILRAASRVFGREGYARATVDAIAAEACVSKKTIYNHFADKAELFREAAMEGVEQVSAHITVLIDRHLSKILDLETDLTDFAVDRVKAIFEAPDEHTAFARTIRAEVTHLPPEVLHAWLDAGPMRSQREIAAKLHGMADRGLLAFDDAGKAADHFTLLSFTPIAERTFFGALPIGDREVAALAREGVRMFLRLYGAQAPKRGE
ncbi:TetR/AcrR family transcriptional regulator [Glycomyces sp. TRM65418]|uniref:TetR/AcrR family transcriptional regulator n=1 Tax=Glycomyces sp. TRM65418 TaxID=2867006 RepID=UPI001CE4C5A9|nr:TetR/AcrR family transcriptional regulator [Glycomyces sp. TRM65418]MCC3764790.1 TetR/AcrR family transcriptional regulator [Glycomyces sp. TRM65418]QZD54443.1 TetR/AcrR family transcriptional regulator [Glycomyces sp. TRM65418]